MDDALKNNRDDRRPLPWWTCLGYMLLFLMPVIGIGFVLAFSAGEQESARRSFARAHLCLFLMVTAAVLLLLVTGVGLRIAAALRT